MRLLLEIQKEGEAFPGGTLNFETDNEMGGLIGSGAKVDFVLPADDDHIAEYHAAVGFAHGHFYVADTSPQGVFLNDNPNPIGQHQSAYIHPGDRLKIGRFVFLVRVEPDAPMALTPPPATPSPSLSQINPIPETWSFSGGSFSEGSFSEGTMQVGAAPMSQMPQSPILPDEFDPLAQAPVSSGPLQRGSPGQVNPAPTGERSASPFDNSLGDPSLGNQSLGNQSLGNLADAQSDVRSRPQSDGIDERETLWDVLGMDRPEDPEARERILQSLRQVFALAASGFTAVLSAQAELREAFQRSEDDVFEAEEQALEFDRSAEESKTNILSILRAGTLPLDAFVEDFFVDVTAYERATLAAMRAANAGLLRVFQPEALEQRLANQGWWLFRLFGSRKARYWKAYTTHYDTVASEAEATFRSLFNEAFSRSYAEQAALLRNQRK